MWVKYLPCPAMASIAQLICICDSNQKIRRWKIPGALQLSLKTKERILKSLSIWVYNYST
jgi:hypothetical protein